MIHRFKTMVTPSITLIRLFSGLMLPYATHRTDWMQPTVGNCQKCLITYIEFYPIDLPRGKICRFYGKLYIRCMSHCFFSRTIYASAYARTSCTTRARRKKTGCPTEKTGLNMAYYRASLWDHYKKHFSCRLTNSLISCQTVAFISGIRRKWS